MYQRNRTATALTTTPECPSAQGHTDTNSESEAPGPFLQGASHMVEGPSCLSLQRRGNSVLMSVPTAPHAHMKAFASNGNRDMRCRVAEDREKGTKQDRRPYRFQLHHLYHLLYSGHSASPCPRPSRQLPDLTGPSSCHLPSLSPAWPPVSSPLR